MDSSVIFLVVLGLWAAYLVPHWLQRREDLSASRSVDRFSDAMRVLARRPSQRSRHPQERSYVLTPPREDVRELEPTTGPVDRQQVVPAPALRSDQAPPGTQVAARGPVRAAAASRWVPRLLAGCLVLGVLLLPVLAVLSVLGLVPLWALAVAPALAATALVTLRVRAVRRASEGSSPRAAAVPVNHLVPEVAQVAQSVVAVPGSSRGDDLYDESVHVAAEEVARLHQLAERAALVADTPYREPEPGEWTPVAVPLPSYLLAPHAPRRWTPDVAASAHEVDADDIPTYAPVRLRAVNQ